MKTTSLLIAMLFGTALASQAATISAFTGGDVGDGLNLSNNNLVYAVNLGSNQADVDVQGVTFTSAASAGVTIGPVQLAGNWGGARNYGATTDDNNLESVMENSLLDWNTTTSGDPRTIDISAPIVSGQFYTLQLFFQEPNADNRFFDLSVEGSLIVDEFHTTMAPSDLLTVGYVVTHTFKATDSTLNLLLTGGSSGNRDPHIQAFTLTAVTPEPSTLGLFAMGAGLLAARRRNRTINLDTNQNA